MKKYYLRDILNSMHLQERDLILWSRNYKDEPTMFEKFQTKLLKVNVRFLYNDNKFHRFSKII